jgi:hypothetical protein
MFFEYDDPILIVLCSIQFVKISEWIYQFRHDELFIKCTQYKRRVSSTRDTTHTTKEIYMELFLDPLIALMKEVVDRVFHLTLINTSITNYKYSNFIKLSKFDIWHPSIQNEYAPLK